MNYQLFIILFSLLLFSPTFAGTCVTPLEKVASKRSIDIEFSTENKAKIVIGGKQTIPIRIGESSINAIANPLGLSHLNRIIQRLVNDDRPISIYEKAATAFGLGIKVDGIGAKTIPPTGPLLVIANHPLSGIEGIAIGAMLAQVRPDVKVVLNKVLTRIPGVAPNAIAIDVQNPKSRDNIKAIREMNQWLKEGNALIIFPAGDVSRPQKGSNIAMDPPWSRSIVKMTQNSNASVLPVYVHGQGGLLFRILDRVNHNLGTAMVPHEILRQENSDVQLTVGEIVDPKTVTDFTDDNAAVAYLREVTYGLRNK